MPVELPHVGVVMYPEQDARIKTLPVLAIIGICPLAAIGRELPGDSQPDYGM